MRSRHMRGWMLAAGALTLALSACGGDDDDAGDTTTADTATVTTAVESTMTTTQANSSTSTTTTVGSSTPDTTSGTDGAGDDQFCTTVIEAQEVATAGPDVDFEAASGEEIADAMEEFSAELLPILDDLTGSAPEEIAEDLQTIDEALRSSMETAEDPASQPSFRQADQNVDRYIADNCDFEVYPVRAVEYAFEDVPSSIESGIVGFDLQNDGQEVHEFILFRINDDVDASIEELLEMPEEEAQQMIEFIGATFAEPGESDMLFHDLRPGRYGAVCFIPVGTTDMSMLGDEPSTTAEGTGTADTTEPSASTTDATGTATSGTATSDASSEMGPPHFTQGMFIEFEVTEASGGSGSSGSAASTTSSGSDSSTPSTTEQESATDEAPSSSPTTTEGSGSSTSTTTG